MSVSISEIPTVSGDVLVYPNPTNGNFTLSYVGSETIETTINLYNLVGQVVLSKAVSQVKGLNTVNYGGKTYNTVSIGTQCWLKENLNIGTRINQNGSQTNNGIIEKYCFNDNESNCTEFGGLYQWNEIMQYTYSEGAQGICPDGWHVPSRNQLSQLATYLGGNTIAGGNLKEAGLTHWASPNTGATNSSGFTALGTGRIVDPGVSWELLQLTRFWTSYGVLPPGNAAYFYELGFNTTSFNMGGDYQGQGYSVRCLKNGCTFPSSPTSGIHTPMPTQIIWNWNTVTGATGYKWNTNHDSSSAIDMGINTSYTETNLTCNTNYIRYIWAYNGCGSSHATVLIQTTTSIPASPVPGTNVITLPSQIEWKWLPVTGAVGYKWSSQNNYANAENVGTNTSRIETGLSCGNQYYRWVWAYNNCGHSSATTLGQVMSINPSSPMEGAHVPSPDQIVWKWYPVANAIGYKWSPINSIATALDLGQDISITETDLACGTPYIRFIWAYDDCGFSPPTLLMQSTSESPAPPTPGSHVPSATQIVWNWNTVSGATGYKWCYENSFPNAIDVGTNTTWTETNLICNTSYTRFVWAYNGCGHTTPGILTQATMSCPFTCGSFMTINHTAGTVAPVAKTVTYGTVNNIPGEPQKCWITSNLGANHQATAKNDATEASAGWYWQFNRKQGFKHDGTTRTPNTTWINPINENLDWQPTNDPCALELGNGWRLPTYAEWYNVDNIGNWTNWNGPWNSGLKLHVAGYLNANDGSLDNRGSAGRYWSNTQSIATRGWGPYFDGSYGALDENLKANGLTL
ncbi:MAG: FISUMP domain-containing protein, partial [Bacteroidota bacterium]